MYIEDLPALFAEFAQAATWTPSGGGAEQTAEVILEVPDKVMLGGDVLAADIQILFRIDQFVGLDEDEEITIGATTYRIAQTPETGSDGTIMQVSVEKL